MALANDKTMKGAKGYGEWVRIGMVVLLALVLYELIIVQLLGNKGYDLRVGRSVMLFSPQWQLVPVILLSFFIVYFTGEFRFRFKRVKQNLLILFCGILLLLICFLFARHIHQLYISTVHKFDSLPKGVGVPDDLMANPARHLARARNILLGIDGILAICMVYLWYNWAEVPAKKSA